MGSLPPSQLSRLQLAVLREFFARERGFFLTGGGALAGFHLGHRTTDDLDLFTTSDEAFERGRHVLADVATNMGGRLEIRQAAPRFVRAVLTNDQGAVVIDLVRDQLHQLHSDKLDCDGIAVDRADEILANKLTTIVGRAEERDLVDVFCLERAGYRVEDALPAAMAKDGGCTPATLAWLLSEVTIPEDLELSGGVSATELRAFVAQLIVRLRSAALPRSS